MIPESWRPVPGSSDEKQNENPAGEINTGYFHYRFEARGTVEPKTSFTFWNGKIANVHQFGASTDTEKSRSFIEDADKILAAFTRELGQPQDEERTPEVRRYKWVRGAITIRIVANLPDPARPRLLGGLTIEMTDQSAHKMAEAFANRYSETQPASGPIGIVSCRVPLSGGSQLRLQMAFAVDTRKLSEDLARKVVETKAETMRAAGSECQSQVTFEGLLEDSLESAAVKRPFDRTYMRTIDADGLLNVIRFPNVGIRVEDLVCDSILKTVPSGAECITGWATWHKTP